MKRMQRPCESRPLTVSYKTACIRRAPVLHADPSRNQDQVYAKHPAEGWSGGFGVDLDQGPSVLQLRGVEEE